MAHLLLLLVSNTILGLLLLSFVWVKTKAMRRVDPELDKENPAWCRYDKKNFNLPVMIFLASTVLVPRWIIMISLLIFYWIICK